MWLGSQFDGDWPLTPSPGRSDFGSLSGRRRRVGHAVLGAGRLAGQGVEPREGEVLGHVLVGRQAQRLGWAGWAPVKLVTLPEGATRLVGLVTGLAAVVPG